MARAAVRVGALLVVPTVAVTWFLRGAPGAWTALGALVLVIGQFAITGRSLAWAAKHGPVALQATALGGFFVRLVTYAALIVLLRPVDAVDGPVLAITTAVSLVVLLVAEVRLVMRHTELWWVTLPEEAPASSGTPVPTLSGKDLA